MTPSLDLCTLCREAADWVWCLGAGNFPALCCQRTLSAVTLAGQIPLQQALHWGSNKVCGWPQVLIRASVGTVHRAPAPVSPAGASLCTLAAEAMISFCTCTHLSADTVHLLLCAQWYMPQARVHGQYQHLHPQKRMGS